MFCAIEAFDKRVIEIGSAPYLYQHNEKAANIFRTALPSKRLLIIDRWNEILEFFDDYFNRYNEIYLYSGKDQISRYCNQSPSSERDNESYKLAAYSELEDLETHNYEKVFQKLLVPKYEN